MVQNWGDFTVGQWGKGMAQQWGLNGDAGNYSRSKAVEAVVTVAKRSIAPETAV